MWARDRAANALGIKIESVGPGVSHLSMPVRGDMVNGHHICHGGLIFSLADTAFAYACNSYNKNTVASACHIDFLAPGMENDTSTPRPSSVPVRPHRRLRRHREEPPERQDDRPVPGQELPDQRRSHRRPGAAWPAA
jgi:phenylacetic acid degradation protein PaaD